MLNTVVFAAMPSAMDATTTAANPRFFRNVRSAYARSCRMLHMKTNETGVSLTVRLRCGTYK